MKRERNNHTRWVDETSPFHYKYPYAAFYRRQLLENTVSGEDYHDRAYRELELSGHERILIVGSGNGLDEVRLSVEHGHEGEIVGLEVPSTDVSFEDRFIVAQQMLDDAGKSNVRFVGGNALSLPFPDNSFDVIVWPYLSYHIVDRFQALTEAQRVLDRGGKFMHLTNNIGNKEKFHEIVNEIKMRLGVEGHAPLSAGFSLPDSQMVLRHFFNPVKELVQDTKYIVTEDDLYLLEAAVDSYRAPISKESSNGWVDVRRAVFEERVLPEIERTGKFLDTAKRGGGIYENNLRLKGFQRLIGQYSIRKNK